MSINQRQFEQLTAMGISLWQSRESHTKQVISTNSHNHAQFQELSEFNFRDSQLFNDVLRCLQLTIGDVTTHTNHLDLGLFNWYFTQDCTKLNAISCNHNKLVTPKLDVLATSGPLKKQLWQTIVKELL